MLRQAQHERLPRAPTAVFRIKVFTGKSDPQIALPDTIGHLNCKPDFSPKLKVFFDFLPEGLLGCFLTFCNNYGN